MNDVDCFHCAVLVLAVPGELLGTLSLGMIFAYVVLAPKAKRVKPGGRRS